MNSTEALALIADAYNPLLVLAWLGAVIHTGRRRGGGAVATAGLRLGAALLVVYGGRALDHALGLWPALGLDYSSHTAFAAALVMCSWRLRPRHGPALAISLLAYLALMWLLGYHTVMDMATTLLAVLPMLSLVDRAAGPQIR